MTTTTETLVPAGTWQLDTIHSSAGFAVRHLVVGTFRGAFTDFDVTLADGKLTGVVQVESIDIRDENLKGHLLTPDFFDVASHPEIRFESVDIRPGLEIEGDLTINGITERVVGQGTLYGPGPDLGGKQRIGVDLEAVVDRNRFGLKWNAPIPGSGGNVLGDDVTITVHAELVEA